MPTDEVSVEQHGEVTRAAWLALYFHLEDKQFGIQISSRTFDFLEYYLVHRQALYKLLIEASILNGYIKLERQKLKNVIEDALASGVDASIEALEKYSVVQGQAEQAIERLHTIQDLIDTGDWRLLDAG